MTECRECGGKLPEVYILREVPADFARPGEMERIPLVQEVEDRVCLDCYEKAKKDFCVRVNGDLNPGIRETVRWLIEHGFNTRDSGDGKTHLMEGDRDYPYVSILVDPRDMLTESHRLHDLLWDRRTEHSDSPTEPTIQVSYNPSDGTAILELLYVDDEILGFKV